MPTRDLHDKPFDAATITKLRIYQSYIQAWLQVFLHAARFRACRLQFYDFFAGPGEDERGQQGSPLILLNELLTEKATLGARDHSVTIFFNDRDQKKIAALKQTCAERSLPWQPRFETLEFADAFRKVKAELGAAPSLVFIDQNGLKHVTPAVFAALAAAQTTDFIFFTASSFKHRFGDLLAPEITLPDDVSYLTVHRALADEYRRLAPPHVFVGHFSIRKDSNIYGLIFGTHHWVGMLKFLEIAWRLDRNCGEADYELEQETQQGWIDFDSGTPAYAKRKLEVFQEELANRVRAREFRTDGDVALHCLTSGFLPRAAKPLYRALRKSGVLKNVRDTFPRSSGDAIKHPRDLVF